MNIYGLNKTTLLDYPGRPACTVFTGNCNFRCIYCHNYSLVLNPPKEALIPEEEIFAFLKKRRGILQGVCITGGEPTVNPGLKDFIIRVKELGYPVKLDSNGYRPEIIRELTDEGLLDMIAMDIKTDRERYPLLTGLGSFDLSKLDESIEIIMQSGIDYEFRTTVIEGFFDEKASHSVGEGVKEAKKLFLQRYEESRDVPDKSLKAPSAEDMRKYAKILSEYIEEVGLRGVD